MLAVHHNVHRRLHLQRRIQTLHNVEPTDKSIYGLHGLRWLLILGETPIWVRGGLPIRVRHSSLWSQRGLC